MDKLAGAHDVQLTDKSKPRLSRNASLGATLCVVR